MSKKENLPGAVDIFGVGLLLPERVPQKIQLPMNLNPELCRAYLCLESVGQDVFNPRKLRRLGHSQKMALVAAHRALEGIDLSAVPELSRAISVGTGLGETGQTATFLELLLQTEEKEPTPMKFINSVHNAIAGQLAIQYGFQGENHTFSHSFNSFELALWQARVLLCAGRAEVVLACGVDEASPHVALVGSRSGWWQTSDGPLSVPGTEQKGTLLGEGATGILLGKGEALPNSKRIAQLAMVRAMPFNADLGQSFNPQAEVAFIVDSLAKIDLSPGEMDFILLGANGDSEEDGNYGRVLECLCGGAKKDFPWGVYKHVSGEFHTASGLGIGLAIQAIRKNDLPEGVKRMGPKPEGLETILVYHLSRRGDHSLCVLRK